MKHIILFLGLLSLSFNTGCGNLSTQDYFILKGEIEGYGDGIIHISFSDPNKIIKDTIIVKNDRFEYRGSLSSPKMAFMKIMGNKNLKKEFYRIDFFMENSVMNLKVNLDDLANYKISGSKSNEEYKKFIKEGNTINQEYIKARKDYAKRIKGIKNPKEKLGLEAELKSARKEYLSYLTNFDNFSSSHISAYILWLSAKHVPFNEIKKIVPLFDSSIRNNVYLEYLVEKIKGENSVKPGAIAADFSVRDIEGKEYSLEDFKGDYLLIEFSASWCTWCKKEYPYLKKAYQEYSNKGLNIIILNLDKTRKEWVKDVVTENLPWPVLSDLKSFDGELTKNYSVRAIPRIFLIDPNGIIVSNSLRGDKILEKLHAIYSEK